MVCKENKYDRHPAKPEIKSTAIPQFPGQNVQLDMTAIYKFSKFAIAKAIKSRDSEDIKQPLRDILFFLIPEKIIFD